ncbi:hypothetical protein VNO78_15713 [Psophocarpus tetragonolobus]|uniref:Uncharacterized protein n=1 Tax=Psophocarpus tetragonolobus TaxID=3891 RepID=A0AAN9SFH1_PSOTE
MREKVSLISIVPTLAMVYLVSATPTVANGIGFSVTPPQGESQNLIFMVPGILIFLVSGIFIILIFFILSCVLESSSLKALYLGIDRLNAASYQDIASLSGLPSLKSLNFEFCTSLTLQALHRLALSNLEILDFSDNDIITNFVVHQDWSGLKALEELDISGNHFTGNIGSILLPSLRHLHLAEMDVSDNAITGQIMSNNISSIFSNLETLDMSKNAIHGSIPSELGQMNLLKTLVLSNNLFFGEIPHELSNLSLLQTLDLSNNHLSGEMAEGIFGVGHKFRGQTDRDISSSMLRDPKSLLLILNDNRLTGRLARSILNAFITELDVSNNYLLGKIPSFKNTTGLQYLRMSNDKFEGSIPLELAKLENLIFLDLSQNNLIGVVPSFINSPLRIIHLNNNQLSGLPKRMFVGRQSFSLDMLDLSCNDITYSLQDLVQDLSFTKLTILLLKDNHFFGNIPRQLCHLINLNILELSHDNLSGIIPNCLGQMPFKNKDPEVLFKLFSGITPLTVNSRFEKQLPNVQEKVNFPSKMRIETDKGSILVYMSGIDLSHNKLQGNIPFENLTRIRSFNLSHNDLMGQIPTTFSNLVQKESLDVSFNKLSGQIPPQLNKLTFLAVFSVAHNNLSGRTPERKRQFSTFEESSYDGNIFLCRPQLPKSCNRPPIILPNDENIYEGSDSLVDMLVFCVSLVVSYTSALLEASIVLLYRIGEPELLLLYQGQFVQVF